MATPSKSTNIALLALQNIAASAAVGGTHVDITSIISGRVFGRFGRNSATNFTNSPIIRVETSYKDTGPPWIELTRFSPVLGASLKAQAVNGTLGAGNTVIPLTSTTNFAIGDIVYIKNTTIGNSEWCRIVSISAGTSITVEENTLFAQTGSTVYRGAEFFRSGVLDFTMVKDIRVVVENQNNANAFDIELYLTEFTAFG